MNKLIYVPMDFQALADMVDETNGKIADIVTERDRLAAENAGLREALRLVMGVFVAHRGVTVPAYMKGSLSMEAWDRVQKVLADPSPAVVRIEAAVAWAESWKGGQFTTEDTSYGRAPNASPRANRP